MVEDKPKRDLDGIVIVVVCLAVLIFFGVKL
jgi:hypothetical protein